MYGIPRHVHFERRRLTLAGLFAFVAGYALYAHITPTAFGLPFPLFTGLLYTALVVLTAAVTSYLLPNLRRLIDGVALTRLAFAAWVVAADGQDIAASPSASAAIVVGGAVVLLRLGTWIDRSSRRPGAPVLLVTFTAQMRTLVAWLDNAAVRGSTNYPASVGKGVATVSTSLPNGLATA